MHFTGLPNTAISDLEISLDDEILTASTYGRGVWQSPIPVQLPENDIRVINISPQEGEIFCSTVVNPEITIENKGTNTITEVEITYSLNNGANQTFLWTGTVLSEESAIIALPTLSIASDFLGEETISVNVSIPNDAFADNNSISSSFIINTAEIANTILTFETEDEALIAYNDGSNGSVWERGVPTGTILNQASSGSQVYGTILNGNHPDNTKGILLSRCYDLSSMVRPVLKFNMAFDLEENFDLVFVQYSIDNGTTWDVLGNINSQPNWYNSDRTNESSGVNNDCQNCPGAQWTGS